MVLTTSYHYRNFLPLFSACLRLLQHTALHYTTLHFTTLHYTTQHYTALHYTTLHYTYSYTYETQYFSHLSHHHPTQTLFPCSFRLLSNTFCCTFRYQVIICTCGAAGAIGSLYDLQKEYPPLPGPQGITSYQHIDSTDMERIYIFHLNVCVVFIERYQQTKIQDGSELFNRPCPAWR